MDVESLMWISIERFGILMNWSLAEVIKACKIELLAAEKIKDKDEDSYRICISNLSVQAMKKHFTEILKAEQKFAKTISPLKEHLNSVQHLNALSYASMRSFEKKSVDKRLGLLIEMSPFSGKDLRKRLKRKHVSYSTFMRNRKNWIDSGGDINSLKVNYHSNNGVINE